MSSVRILDMYAFRYPIEIPVRTSFGVMHDRPAVLVRLEDADGCHGWGEIWCNFPACGAEHRLKLCETVVGPLLLGQPLPEPAELFAALTRQTHILALQSREAGAIDQVIAGVLGAAADLQARKAGQPLHRFLGGFGDGRVPVYASGINRQGAEESVRRHQDLGYSTFKVKIGLDFPSDLATVEAVLGVLSEGQTLCLDVNQAWSPVEAEQRLRILSNYPLGWLEEPIASDHGVAAYAQLTQGSEIPVAAGENIYGLESFQQYLDARALRVVQPDCCKWGGPALCLEVARRTLTAGMLYCPHFLGAGVGLWTSAHILAAVGGPGLLEVDVNHNPLQTLLGQPRPAIVDGACQLPDAPGLGVEPDLAAARPYLVASATLAA